MTTDRIKEIQQKTAYPNSVSIQQALLQVWNECEQDNKDKKYTEEDINEMACDFVINVGGLPKNIKEWQNALWKFYQHLNKQD